ncbi:MAG: glutathione S-transferase family protein [Pseudomonadota bacterium]
MRLYGYRNGRTLRVLWALEEIEAGYEYVEVDIMQSEGQEPWFLQVNPTGKVPVLVDGELIIPESAAICMYLAEKYPHASLIPDIGTAARAQCYSCISFILTEMDAPLWTIAKHRFALPKEKRVTAVIDTAIWEFQMAAAIFAEKLTESPFLIGSAFTVADILAGHTLLWAKSVRIELASSKLESYLEALLSREAAIRARRKTA